MKIQLIGVLVAVGLIVGLSIASHRPPPIEIEGLAESVPADLSGATDFLRALGLLDVGWAERNEATDDERAFLEGLDHLIEGRWPEARRAGMLLVVADGLPGGVGLALALEASWAEQSWDDCATFAHLLRGIGGDYGPGLRILGEQPRQQLAFEGEASDLLLRRSYSGLALAPAVIGGHELDVALDTGSDISVITESAAQRYGAKVFDETIPMGTSTGESLEGRLALLPQLRLGSLVVTNHVALLAPDDSAIMIALGIDTVIGLNLLQHLVVEIDTHRERIVLRQPGAPHDGPRNLFLLHRAVVRVTAPDGTALHMLLDTGADLTTLTTDGMQRLGLVGGEPVERPVLGYAPGDPKIETLQMHEAVTLHIGRHALHFARLGSQPSDGPMFLATRHGTLGMDALTHGRVVIDFPNGQLTLMDD